MIFIDNDQLLQECCQRLSQEELIAVDTEFMRDTNSLLLCLIQLAINDEVYIIDVLQCNLAPLVGIFSNEKILKVFHAARQDLECLWNAGISVINCYDTQMYEMLLDIKQDISYRQIVLKYCNKVVSKQEKRSDWSARPLSHAQLCYSANDVFYLRKVYLHQLHHLTQVGRLNWLEDDMVRLNDLIRQQPLSTDKQYTPADPPVTLSAENYITVPYYYRSDGRFLPAFSRAATHRLQKHPNRRTMSLPTFGV